MNYICKICNKEIENNSHFWTNHNLKISEYFQQYEPRETKDGKKVLFKRDIEDYFATDFNDLISRNSWIKANREIGIEYLLSLITKRKEKKNWKYAPGQTLLCLSNICSALFLEREFNKSYPEICKTLGLKIKYKNSNIDIDWSTPLNIILDTREKKAFSFPTHFNITISKVEYGDYTLVENPKITIERKSISDLAGTLSAGYERFQRELKRARKDRGYIVILVESPWNDFKSIEYLPQTRHIKSTYDHLAKRARDLYEQFDNFQLVFADNRKHAVKIAELVLKLGKKVKQTDLQLLVDKKLV